MSGDELRWKIPTSKYGAGFRFVKVWKCKCGELRSNIETHRHGIGLTKKLQAEYDEMRSRSKREATPPETDDEKKEEGVAAEVE